MIVTRNMPPMVGGIESIIWEIVRRLPSKYRLTIAAPTFKTENATTKDECNFIQIPGSTPLEFLVHAPAELAKAMGQKRFDYVICSSGLSAVVYWKSKNLTTNNIIILAHGLDIGYARSDLEYKATLQEIINKSHIVANSKFTETFTKSIFIIDDNRITTLHPPPRVLDVKAQTFFNSNLNKITSLPFLLSVGRAIERKGIQSFISKSLSTIIQKYPNIQYVVVGPNTDDPEYINNALSNIKEDCRKNIHFLGFVNDTILSELYKKAIALIFPVLDINNNPEGFGLVVLEAAAYGTPTIAFASGGVPEAIANTKSGRIVAAGNYHRFTHEVINVIKKRYFDEGMTYMPTYKTPVIEDKWDEYIERVILILENMKRSHLC